MDETISFAAALQRQIYELVRAHELCDRACLAQNGVTAAQGYTLLAFPEQDGLTMNALSDQMRLSNSTMTRMIDQLVQKGFVLRRPDDEDRRVVRVELTDQGREIRSTLEQSLRDLFSLVLNEIDEAERPLILHALEQVTRSVVSVLSLKNCCGE
jgi:DNA-binding MarR family transcriptional regulator